MAEAGTFTPDYSFLDRSFTDRERRQCRLLAAIGNKRISFSVIHEAKVQLMAMGDVHLENREYETTPVPMKVTELFPWCGGEFKSIHVALDSGSSTLIPASYFDESGAFSLMDFNGRIEEGEIVASEHLNTLHAFNVYPVSSLFRENIGKLFPGAILHHLSTPLIEGLLHFPVLTESRVFMHLRDDFIDIAITANGSLRYFNTFTKQTREDVAYFLMFVLEQLGLDPEKTDVRLLGRISRGDEVYNVLFRYIRTLSFPDPVDYFRELVLPPDMPSGVYFPVLNLFRCES